MTFPRVFVSYAFSDRTQREDQFTNRLVNDLRAAGADVIVDEVSSTNDDLAQSLNHVLPGCDWLVLVQTPASLRSPRVRLAVNTALNLVVQGRMQGVLRVITELCDPGEVPPTWTTLDLFDASKDYARALTRVLLALGLVGQPERLQNTKQSYDVPQSSASHISSHPFSIVDRPAPLSSEAESWKSAIPSLVQLDRPSSPPTLPLSPRQRRHLPPHLLLVLMASIILIIVSTIIVYFKSNPNRSTAIAITTTKATQAMTTATLYVKPSTTADSKHRATTAITPRPNATATTISHPTPSSSPTQKGALSPTPTLPPLTTPTSPPPTTPTSPPPPTTPTLPPTYAETTGGDAHTWTNYTNAGGNEGPTIASYATEQIACKITGFVVADGNPWWYRVASSPWNNAYYVSADAFYNNGQTSGSLHGTPFVDPNVPNC